MTALCFSRGEAILSVQRPKKHRKFFSFRNELGNTFKLPFLVRHDLCFKSRSLHLRVLPSTSLLSQDPRRPRTRKERCCLRRRTGRRCCEILFGLQIRSLLAGGSNTYQSYVDLRAAFFPISWDFLCGMQGRRVVSRGHWVKMGQMDEVWWDTKAPKRFRSASDADGGRLERDWLYDMAVVGSW